LISSFRLHPLADLTRLWEALHAGKVILVLVAVLALWLGLVLFLPNALM
jgi:hypothetical protein